MAQKIPDETIEKLRERMKNGADASQVAQEFGITTTTVYLNTKDLPRKHSRIPLEQKEQMRELVRQGYSKRDVARRFNRNFRTIQAITKGMPGYEGYRNAVGPEEKRILGRLLQDGFVISDFSLYAARNLKMQFPIIRSVRISRKTVFYLHGKEKEMIKGYLASLSTRIVNYATLEELCEQLGIQLSLPEQKTLIQQSKLISTLNQVHSTIQKKLADFGWELILTF